MKDSKTESKGILVDEILKITNINFRFQRISSMLLNHAIMSIVIVPPMVLIMFLLTEKRMLIDNEVLLASVVFFPLMFVYLNKDFFNGKSPAKKNFRLSSRGQGNRKTSYRITMFH